MANVHSAIKAIRKDVKRRARNQGALTELHSLWKKFGQVVEAAPDQAKALAQTLSSKWDRALSRGIVPKGRANRKKARIAHALAKVKKSS